MLETGLAKGDHIHIALGYDQALYLAGRFTCRHLVIKCAALVKQRGFWGIQILGGLVGIHCTAAKGGAATPRIADREHDSAPKSIKRVAAVIGLDRQPRHDNIVRRHPFAGQVLKQATPAIIGITDLKLFQRGFGQAALLQVIPRVLGRIGAQLQTVILHRLFHHIDQNRALISLFLSTRITLGQRHTGLTRQYLDRFDEIHVFGFLYEAVNIALGMAAKTIIKAFLVIDMKRRGFFRVKRAGRPIIALAGVGFTRIPSHFAPCDLSDRGTVTQFINKTGW